MPSLTSKFYIKSNWGRSASWLVLLVAILASPHFAIAGDDPSAFPPLDGPALLSGADGQRLPPVDSAPDALETPSKAATSGESSDKDASRTFGTEQADAGKSAAKPGEEAAAKNSEKPEGSAKKDAKAGENTSKNDEKDDAKHDDEKKLDALLGDSYARGKMNLLLDEIKTGIAKRQLGDTWARWQSYAAGRVNASAGKYTGSELTGNCRISWYDHLMRHVLAAPAEAEKFTRELHKGALGGRDGFAYLLAIAAQKMDLSPRKPKTSPAVASPEQALEILKQAIAEAQVAYAAALAPLTKTQIRDLETNIYPVFIGQNNVGHTLNDRYVGRRLCDTIELIDRDSLHAAADALAPLTDLELLDQLKKLDPPGKIQAPGVSGQIVEKIETPSGTIFIGGKGANTYQLDKIPDLRAVVDLGGNDTYIDGTVGTGRPVLVLLDLAGNDIYRSAKPGVQGGAILGVSMLLDYEGDDVYEAQDAAQASAVAGVGILIDFRGNDRYKAFRRAQGQALGGLGVLIDKEGNDDYRAALWAQGLGNPLGFGLLDDLQGDDHYFCGGMWPDSYPETPGCEGWGQGVGGGIRQVASGGIGVILDGAGDDVYEFDYLAHGGGYWCGLGFARDFGGNDQRLITRKSYDGGSRQQPVFQRFGIGWGCHYSLGFCFDDGGDDLYQGTIMGSGMAWDCAMGVLCDFAGNDRYQSSGGLTQGTSQQMGFGILFEYDGDDQYDGYSQGYAATGISYHPMPDCGGNFAFLVDYGGKDKYGSGAQNNSYLQRGMQSGYLIDRPREDEIQPTAEAPKNPPAVNKSGNQITARKTKK
ncbi:MAG: hypothetical protein IT426_13130 [Pirellulales bacterium]|nr:hypothetical protein [Pirellulales bacterium]